MVNLATLLVGPLAGPECRRAVARGWLILVRALAATAVFGVTLLAYWVWGLEQSLDGSHQPFWEIRIALGLVAGMLLTLALVLGPALLAGSLAGEKERGSLALLLTTRVTSREIVSGRVVGKLAQLGMILLACLPAFVLLISLAGFRPTTFLAAVLLPTAVGIGGGGLAAAASVLSRRGRDALLAVYLVDLFLLLTPLSSTVGLPRGAFDWVAAFNPYIGLEALIQRETLGEALTSSALWLLIGAAGTGVAAWRLRPSCLAPTADERVGARRARRGFVPPVSEKRPMAWKELFIEQVATLGRFGRWAGRFLIAGLTVTSVGLTAVVAWDVFYRGETDWTGWARNHLSIWVGDTGALLSCLIQWAIGLRAAVSISSERERGTWDALMTSPLKAGEIVAGKLYGSLFALRWLILAAFLAWTLAACSGALPARDAVRWGFDVLIVGAFMAAVGVRTSLACATATRAMSLTIGIWLGAYVVVWVTSGILILIGLLLCNAVWIAASQLGLVTPIAALWTPLPAYIAWPLARNTLYLLATFLIVADTRLRFDRIAGRMTEGAASVAFDNLVYGRPEAPALLEAGDGASGSPTGEWPAASADQCREDPAVPSS